MNLAGTLGLLTTKELLSELKSTCGSFVEVEGHLENVKLVGREHRVGIRVEVVQEVRRSRGIS